MKKPWFSCEPLNINGSWKRSMPSDNPWNFAVSIFMGQIKTFCWKSKVIMLIASFEVLFSPRVQFFPFQLCWVPCLSLLLDPYPFSPFSWCSGLSSRGRFILSSPPQDNNAMSKASHLAHVSFCGKLKLRLNSLLNIFLYVYINIFNFWGVGEGKCFSCLDLRSRERMYWVSIDDNPEQKVRDISAKQMLSLKHYSVFEKVSFFCL